MRSIGTTATRKIRLDRLRFDPGARIPGDPGFAGPGAGASGAGGNVATIPSVYGPTFPGTGGAYGPPGSGLQSAQESAAEALYSEAQGAAGRAAYAASGPQPAPVESPRALGPAVRPPITIVNEHGHPLPVVGAGRLLRPGYKVHHLGSEGHVPVAETAASALSSTGASQAALSLSGRLGQIGRASAGLIGYEATKTALEKIARGEMPTLPELTGLVTFAASLYLLAPEEGLGWVAAGLAWLSTIGRGLIKAGEVAAATEVVDIGERLVSDVGQQSGRLLQSQQPTPSPVAAAPAVQALQRELQPPGPSVPLESQPAAPQTLTVPQQSQPQSQPLTVPQQSQPQSQPLTVPQQSQQGQPLTLAQQEAEIQSLMQAQPSSGSPALSIGQTQPHLNPLEAFSGQSGSPPPEPQPLLQHQPGGCYSPQQMQELVGCQNFQKAMQDHFHIVHQPGQRPTLTPKVPVCICCDSAQDMRDYVESGGVRGACMQVDGLQNIHPKLGG